MINPDHESPKDIPKLTSCRENRLMEAKLNKRASALDINYTLTEAIKSGHSPIGGLTYNAESKQFRLSKSVDWYYDTDHDNYLVLEANERFVGSGYTITVIGGESNGIFASNYDGTDLNESPMILDLKVTSSVSEYAGGLFRANQKSFRLQSCSHNGDVGVYGGALIGSECDNFEINNCQSNGDISEHGGGIVGSSCRNGTISKANTEGRIGALAGGITGSSGHKLTITWCCSNGEISYRGGGIAGSYNNYGSISNSYSRGNIGEYGGGIVGSHAIGMIIYGCYSSGDIGTFGGGIVGSDVGSDVVTNINSCYSLGEINRNSGGIVGDNASGKTGVKHLVTNCYSTGYINPKAAGIVAVDSSYIHIEDCYSKGERHEDGFGIFEITVRNITYINCYAMYPERNSNANRTWFINEDMIRNIRGPYIIPTSAKSFSSSIWLKTKTYPILKSMKKGDWRYSSYQTLTDRAEF